MWWVWVLYALAVILVGVALIRLVLKRLTDRVPMGTALFALGVGFMAFLIAAYATATREADEAATDPDPLGDVALIEDTGTPVASPPPVIEEAE